MYRVPHNHCAISCPTSHSGQKYWTLYMYVFLGVSMVSGHFSFCDLALLLLRGALIFIITCFLKCL